MKIPFNTGDKIIIGFIIPKENIIVTDEWKQLKMSKNEWNDRFVWSRDTFGKDSIKYIDFFNSNLNEFKPNWQPIYATIYEI
jgi:hypothetical protein